MTVTKARTPHPVFAPLVGLAGAHTSPRILSVGIGCVEPSSSHDLPQSSELKLAEVQRFIGAENSSSPQIMLAGGTATTAAALLLGLDHYDGAAVHGTRVTAAELVELAECVREANDAGSALSWFRGPGTSICISLGWLSDSRRRSLPVGCKHLAELMLTLSGAGMEDAHAVVSNRDLLDALIMRQQEQ